MAVEDIVAQREGNRVPADEVAGDDECLGDAVRTFLSPRTQYSASNGSPIPIFAENCPVRLAT